MAASFTPSVLDGLRSRIDMMVESALSLVISFDLKLSTMLSICSIHSSSIWFDSLSSGLPRSSFPISLVGLVPCCPSFEGSGVYHPTFPVC
jgi:hypothetical protein